MACRAWTTLRPDWLWDLIGNMITTTYAKIPNYDIMGSDLRNEKHRVLLDAERACAAVWLHLEDGNRPW